MSTVLDYARALDRIIDVAPHCYEESPDCPWCIARAARREPEQPARFDPERDAREYADVPMHVMALAHARAALDEPAYAPVALDAVDYYLSQMVRDEEDVPAVTPP